MKTKLLNKLAQLCFFLVVVQCSFAQNGSITGIIIDNIGVLPGASVYVKNTENGTTTDFDGNFTINNVTNGNNTIVISFVGYQTLEKTVTVENGKTTRLGTISLTEAVNQLDQVVIKGTYYPSQVRALNIKKKGLAITEVLAADAIGKLPDRNAAEAVQRMQGVAIERDMGEGRRVIVRGAPTHWTSVLLNGNRLPSAGGASDERYTQLDIFPSELIQYVQLNKALTPDIDGDAIGGALNFITKSAPLRQTISATVAGGYNTRADDPSYNASVVYGDRIGEKFGFIASGVVWDRQTGIDRYQVDYDYTNENETEAFAINTLQLRDYVARRRTAGFNLGMDYDLTDNSKVYVKGLYSQYLDQQDVRETYFNFYNNNIQYQARHADYLTNLYSVQLGGDFKLNNKLNLDVIAQYSNSNFKLNSPKNLPESERGYPIVNFIQPMNYLGLSSDGNKYLAMDSPDRIGGSIDNISPNLASAIDPSQTILNQVILSSLKKDETHYVGKFDLTYNSNDKLDIKFGSKATFLDRTFDSYNLVKMQGALLGVPNTPASVTLSQLQTQNSPFDGSFINEIGNVYDVVNYNTLTNNQIDQIYSNEFAEEHGLITLVDKDSPSNAPLSYTGKEDVFSGYAMATYKINEKFELIGGIRNESNHLEFSGKRVTTNDDGTEVEDITVSKNYNAFLPMIHLKTKFSEKTILRTAVTRTYARPTFSRLNPGTQVNTFDRTITEGNTQLDPTFSTNFDAMFEFYPAGVGLISAGAYYKSLSNYIYDDQSIVEYNNENYLLSRPDNLDSAWLYGFEIGIVKRFDKAQNFLKNFGVELNYSYIDSEVEIPTYTAGTQTGTYKTSLPEQANHIGNAILVFENDKLMLRAAGNYKGKYLNQILTIAGPEHYRWFGDNFTVDFSGAYNISDNLRAFIEVNNITNAPNRYYHGTSDRPEQAGWSGIRGQVGLSYTLR
ncbi:MAG: TonB-dependent receptor [Lacinutrix venerupis]